MKKLLSILGTTSLVATSTISLVACHSKLKTNDRYFDSEINNIDPIIRNYVRYTSSIAKILIAARHENMNTYAYPTLQYFLNNMANNLQRTFTTKTGEKIAIGDYIDGYKKLNNVNINARKAEGATEYLINKNQYKIMNSIVETQNFNKWNMINPTFDDFEVNPATSWAHHDTGALANTLTHYSKGVNGYIAARSKWFNYYSDAIDPAISNLFIYNSLSSPPNTQELSYVDQTNSQKIAFGQKIARQSSALYDLFGTKYFNIAASGLTNFGRGVELPTLYALTQIMPFAKTDYESEEPFGYLLAVPLVIVTYQIKNQWFDKKNNGKVKPDCPLLDVFGESTINDTKIAFKDNKASAPEAFGLYDILNKIKAMDYFTSSNKKQYLDLTNSEHQDLFLRWYAILNAWFKKAIATEQQINQNFNSQQFNIVISAAIANEVNKLQKDPIYNVMVGTMSDEATALIRTVVQMLNSPGFDIYNLLQGIGGFASWIFKQEGDDFIVNAYHVKHIEKVYNADPNKYEGYSTNLGNVDPASKYGELVLQEFGLKSQGGSIDYDKDSLFDMINTWAHGGNGSNPDNEAMHQFILNTVVSHEGYLGKLLNNIDQAMANDWFDNIFLNKNWNITAEGTGVDGTTLGKVYKDGQLVGARYQLDYYGPKDSSTDLGHHHQPLRYTNSASGRAADWDPTKPKERVDVPNMAPNDNWEKTDWEAYDGQGTAYLKNSEQVKYSYVVEFDDEARMLETFVGRDDLTSHAFKMMDFVWYYNDKRYY